MKHDIMVVIDIYELRDEIDKMFPDAPFNPRYMDGGLGVVLFEDYGNDCYKRFSYEDGPIEYNYTPSETNPEENQKQENRIKLYNYAIAVLEKNFPSHKEVLIDLSW